MLRDRLIVGLLGGVLAICILLFGNEMFFSLIISLIALIGLAELYNVLGVFKKNIFLAVIGYIAAIVILYFTTIGSMGIYFRMFVCIYMLVLLVYMVFAHKKTSINDISINIFSTMYVVLFFAYLILMRKGDNGRYLIWIPFVIGWLSDTMAYTFGRLFGKHKLIPAVSPKKTVEGAIGGVFGGIFFIVIYSAICKYYCDLDINWLSVIILGMLGAIISQIGDLSASWIKREYNTKDYGNLLPGHGGVLDRFDSVMVVAPFVYYYIQLFPIF